MRQGGVVRRHSRPALRLSPWARDRGAGRVTIGGNAIRRAVAIGLATAFVLVSVAASDAATRSPGSDGVSSMQLGVNSLLAYACQPTSVWDTWATNQVDGIKNLGANAIALAFPLYTDSPTSNNFYAKTTCGLNAKFQTPPPALVAQVVDDAHSAGLTVLLRPYLDQTVLAATSLFDWKGNIAPTKPRVWFTNYIAALKPYLQMAQEHGVEHVAISTELESMANSPYWSATIAAARRLYSGDLAFCSSWVNNGDEAPWPGTSEAIDMYRGIAHVSNAATPAELEAGWNKVLETNDPLPSITSVTADEVGIPAQDNLYAHPNGSIFPLKQYPFDQTIQANWYAMACDFAKSHHMAGIYFWGSALYLDHGLLLSSPMPSQSQNLQPLAQVALRHCFVG